MNPQQQTKDVLAKFGQFDYHTGIARPGNERGRRFFFKEEDDDNNEDGSDDDDDDNDHDDNDYGDEAFTHSFPIRQHSDSGVSLVPHQDEADVGPSARPSAQSCVDSHQVETVVFDVVVDQVAYHPLHGRNANRRIYMSNRSVFTVQ